MDFVFVDDLRIYFVMPYIDGGELYKVFFQKKRFQEHEVKFMAAQIVLGVGALH